MKKLVKELKSGDPVFIVDVDNSVKEGRIEIKYTSKLDDDCFIARKTAGTVKIGNVDSEDVQLKIRLDNDQKILYERTPCNPETVSWRKFGEYMNSTSFKTDGLFPLTIFTNEEDAREFAIADELEKLTSAVKDVLLKDVHMIYYNDEEI